ncbi:glycoside hydrolase family 5 protein [Paucibacter sp. B2R-40]|uniref:glycoside hydrolase family 5 protein n=1 Tax=Paucibacter sp. B2R-40 TaxID=2893554 RepID=UPI0021E4D369|nr:glycoside hydrolase family 5 protein [Paucibacter sp. B2R-40]MCV2356435.1 glycoside hydrolase family 5 protein [Paucibacter sp. B2R-40]
MAAIAQQLPQVKVAGNQFVDDQGAALVFRGVNISDPDKLVKEGHFSRQHFEVIKAWGANVVRIPVHPSAWQRRGKKGYLEILDQTVHWLNELGMYAIVDWHSIGNLKSELFQNSSYATTKAETFDFFRTVAARYKGVNAVAMFEIFNEPTVFGGQLGVLSWADWKAINEEAITIIQAHNPNAISLVAGFNWAYDLTPIATEPIERSNVAYVSHPYPMKVAAPFEQNWERDWGFVANKYPVIATEIGYQLATDKGAHIPVIDDGSYGNRITNYLSSKGVSWVAWVFDPDWAPQLIQDWHYEPTLQGKHFRAVMLRENKR